MAASKRQIDDFWTLKRLAVVGVSREPKEFSHVLWQELRQRRYDAVPVNPNTTIIDGRPCYPRVQDIEPPVEGVVILTRPNVTDRVVEDCAAAGVRRVWMHAGAGVGSVSKAAIAYCEAHDIEVIAGFCPYMFLEGTPFIHGVHGFVKKLTGSYPK